MITVSLRQLTPLILAILSLALLTACGLNTANNAASTTPTGDVIGLDVGNQAPNFTTQLVSGQTVTLESLKGRIVLVNFWATWCGPCRAEMPFFQRLADSYDKRDFQVLAIDFLEGPEPISKFTSQLGLKFDIGLDQK
ncbi:MAG: TlpA family protein disulfide reductase, partial [Anaerolineae bacterium]|nr:TlpA family protein disulfide reductase [Anaerolineae bacterium]